MKNIFILALSVLMIASCSTSNEVASNKLFQKRKYTKGWNMNTSPAIDNSKGTDKKDIAVNTDENTEAAKAPATSDEESAENSLSFNQESTFPVELTEIESYEPFIRNENSNSNKVETSVNASHFYSNNKLNTSPEIEESTKDSFSSDQEESNNSSDDDMLILLYLCAIFIPFVAVGIVTDWDLTVVLINILLTILCFIPGVIHAFITIRDYYR